VVSPPHPTVVSVLLSVLILAGLIAIARKSRSWTIYPEAVATALAGRWTPAASGTLTFIIVTLIWRSLAEPGVVHDERAYLLQAEIFAHGRWTAAPPPIADFFEQVHVFIEPAVFAKYPPAHALTLVPGIWLGLPGLMPALLTGVAGALVFWLARRLANQWVALLTWWLWTTSWANLHWAATYFSETTSTAMWLIALWATIRWLDSERPRYLVYAAAAVAWGVNTRPLTLAALSLPLAFVIVKRVVATRAWKPLVTPVLVGSTLLALGPIWNQHTMGDWRSDPYPYYSRVYFPFDKPGFGVDPAAPLRHLPPELAAVGDVARPIHESYTPRSLPMAFAQRFFGILFWCAEGWRLGIAALIIAAVRHGSRLDRFGALTVGILLAAYLVFAHPQAWIVYYVEVLPILFFLGARELGRIFHTFGGLGPEQRGAWPAQAVNACLGAAVLLLPFGVSDVVRVRAAVDQRHAFNRLGDAAIRALPAEKAIVFVHYPQGHNPHLALTRNEVDLAAARQWVVYDRGTRNDELRALAPDRRAYLLDAATFRLTALGTTRAATGTEVAVPSQARVFDR
jgi:dolichyl-phosphate-mannose-protein mannosyltransferase